MPSKKVITLFFYTIFCHFFLCPFITYHYKLNLICNLHFPVVRPMFCLAASHDIKIYLYGSRGVGIFEKRSKVKVTTFQMGINVFQCKMAPNCIFVYVSCLTVYICQDINLAIYFSIHFFMCINAHVHTNI